MLIGIDLDEVLADTITELVNFHNLKHKTSFKRDDVIHYELWRVFGGTEQEAIEKVYEFFLSPRAKKLSQ